MAEKPDTGHVATPVERLSERLDHVAGRLDHMDEMLHNILSVVEPVGRFIEANKHLIERANKALDPLGLRARRAGRNGG